MEAIVYCSKSGHTLKYATKLAEDLNLPLFNISTAKRKLKKNDSILFMSWVCEDKLVGYEKISKFHVECVIAVGIMPESTDIEIELKHNNFISSRLFYLRGGINKKKLSLRQKIALKLIEKSLSFELLDSGLTKAKSSALDAIQKEIDYTDLDKLNTIIDFLGLKDGYVS